MYASTDVAKNVYVVDQKLGGGGGGNCLFLRAREWGIDLHERKILQIPGRVPGGGKFTSKIAACIIRDLVLFVTQASSRQCQGGKGLRDATP